MDFEFDPVKSQSNLEKHGIDFEAAQALWSDPFAIAVPVATHSEPRFIVIGRIKDKFWTAACTERGKATRIISVRRSRKKEIAAYDDR